MCETVTKRRWICVFCSPDFLWWANWDLRRSLVMTGRGGAWSNAKGWGQRWKGAELLNKAPPLNRPQEILKSWFLTRRLKRRSIRRQAGPRTKRRSGGPWVGWTPAPDGPPGSACVQVGVTRGAGERHARSHKQTPSCPSSVFWGSLSELKNSVYSVLQFTTRGQKLNTKHLRHLKPLYIQVYKCL